MALPRAIMEYVNGGDMYKLGVKRVAPLIVVPYHTLPCHAPQHPLLPYPIVSTHHRRRCLTISPRNRVIEQASPECFGHGLSLIRPQPSPVERPSVHHTRLVGDVGPVAAGAAAPILPFYSPGRAVGWQARGHKPAYTLRCLPSRQDRRQSRRRPRCRHRCRGR